MTPDQLIKGKIYFVRSNRANSYIFQFENIYNGIIYSSKRIYLEPGGHVYSGLENLIHISYICALRPATPAEVDYLNGEISFDVLMNRSPKSKKFTIHKVLKLNFKIMTVKDLKIGHSYKCTSTVSKDTYIFKFGGISNGQITAANHQYLLLIENTWKLRKCINSEGRLMCVQYATNLIEVPEYTIDKVTGQYNSEETLNRVVKLTIKHSLKLSFKL